MDNLNLLADPEDQIDISPVKQMTVDEAYAASADREFLGMKFHGWSGRRRAATLQSGFQGDGDFFDITRVAYYCCVKYTKVSSVYMNKDAAIEDIVKWGEENKCLTFGDENFKKAMDLVQSVLEEAEKSMFESSERDDTGPADLSGNSDGHQD
jgi:signal recognition particle GTPase